MTQYVMFQSTPEIVKAIEDDYIIDLTPNKVYGVVGGDIIDNVGCAIYIVLPEYGRTYLHLRSLAQWQYCDAEGESTLINRRKHG